MRWKLELVWPYCPDGVEVIDTGPRPQNVKSTIITDAMYGRYLKPKSAKQAATVLTLDYLDDPVCVALANAGTTEKLLDFFSRYGLLDGNLSPVFCETAVGLGQDVTRLLEIACGPDTETAANLINRQLNRHRAIIIPKLDKTTNPPRMILMPADLHSFMLMELMAIVEAGARLVACEYCGKLFLTGRRTTRRSTARFCKDLCRTYAGRKK